MVGKNLSAWLQIQNQQGKNTFIDLDMQKLAKNVPIKEIPTINNVKRQMIIYKNIYNLHDEQRGVNIIIMFVTVW